MLLESVINFLFHLCCLAGLIWQFMEISVIYFKFDVVSNVAILMPGEEARTSLNICFLAEDVVNYTRGKIKIDEYLKNNSELAEIIPERHRDSFYLLKRVIDKYEKECTTTSWLIECRYDRQHLARYIFTVAYMLDITKHYDELFRQNPDVNESMTRKYLLRNYVCYNINGRINTDAEHDWATTTIGYKKRKFVQIGELSKESFRLVKKTVATLGPYGSIPWTGLFSSTEIELTKLVLNEVHMSGNSFAATRVPWPYVEDCVDYKKLGFLDRDDAINSCMNDIGIEKHKIGNGIKIFMKGINYQTGDMEKYRNLCSKKFYNSDCSSLNMVTKPDHTTKEFTPSINHTRIWYTVTLSKDPSFEVASQPKIVPIDYITYILGACGTWFGFSFLMFNPTPLVKYCFRKNNSLPSADDGNEISKINKLIGKNKKHKKTIAMLINRVKCVEERLDHVNNLIQNLSISELTE